MKLFKTKSFNSVWFIFLVGLVIEICVPSYVLACSVGWDEPQIDPALMSVRSGVIDSGSVLGGWSGIATPGFWVTNCSAATAISTVPNSTQAASELAVSDGGRNYVVYPTDINNIGYYVRVKDPHNADTSFGRGNHRSWLTRGNYRVSVRFVATGPLEPRVYLLPAREIINIQSVVRGSSWGELLHTRNGKISYSATTVTVTGPTCSVLTADQNQQVVLPTVSGSSLQGVGSTAGSQGFTIGVNCPAGVALHATMTDANSPANTSNILTLAEDSTATGVGLQISATDRAHVVSYGADSRVAGNNNQWFVGGNATSPRTNHIIPFTVRYVQTAAAVQPGTVRARSTITFSYQ
jgi:type 1 fimbria pilin